MHHDAEHRSMTEMAEKLLSWRACHAHVHPQQILVTFDMQVKASQQDKQQEARCLSSTRTWQGYLCFIQGWL